MENNTNTTKDTSVRVGPEIIDLTQTLDPKPALKPIFLECCLQDFFYKDGVGEHKYRFSKGDYSRYLKTGVDGIIFMGKWNDGIVS